jgi:hypothetical protein
MIISYKGGDVMEYVVLRLVAEDPPSLEESSEERELQERLEKVLPPFSPERQIFEAICEVPNCKLRMRALWALWWSCLRNADSTDGIL